MEATNYYVQPQEWETMPRDKGDDAYQSGYWLELFSILAGLTH